MMNNINIYLKILKLEELYDKYRSSPNIFLTGEPIEKIIEYIFNR